jgi:hypothetical protein
MTHWKPVYASINIYAWCQSKRIKQRIYEELFYLYKEHPAAAHKYPFSYISIIAYTTGLTVYQNKHPKLLILIHHTLHKMSTIDTPQSTHRRHIIISSSIIIIMSKPCYDWWLVGQAVLVSSPIQRSRLDYCQTVAVLLMWGTLSHERMGMLFTAVTMSSTCHLYLIINSMQAHARKTDRKIPNTCTVFHIIKCPKPHDNPPEYCFTLTTRNYFYGKANMHWDRRKI